MSKRPQSTHDPRSNCQVHYEIKIAICKKFMGIVQKGFHTIKFFAIN